MKNKNVNYGGKTPYPSSIVKKLYSNLTQTNKNKFASYLPTFTKTIQPLQSGGYYIKTFNNY